MSDLNAPLANPFDAGQPEGPARNASAYDFNPFASEGNEDGYTAPSAYDVARTAQANPNATRALVGAATSRSDDWYATDSSAVIGNGGDFSASSSSYGGIPGGGNGALLEADEFNPPAAAASSSGAVDQWGDPVTVPQNVERMTKEDSGWGSEQSPSEVSWAFKVFTCRGMPIFISYTLPLLFIIDCVNCLRWDDSFIWMTLFVFLDLILLASILLHELGHCAMTKILGGTCSHILLWPLGGLAYVGHGGGNKREFLIALAGPITHVPQMLLWAVVFHLEYPDDEYFFEWVIPIKDWYWRNFLAGLYYQQIWLIAINVLIPAWPLDGGRMMASFLLNCTDARSTAGIMAVLNVLFGVGLAIWGGVSGFMMLTLLGGWLLYQGYRIYSHRSSNTLHQYPLFSSVLPASQNNNVGSLQGGGSQPPPPSHPPPSLA